MNIDLRARRLVVLLVGLGALMAGIAIVAWGVDDDRSSRDVTSKDLTRSAYITAADQLCRELNGKFVSLNARIRQVFEVHTDEADGLRAVANLIEQGYRQRREGQTRFRELGVPRADRAVVQTIRTLYDRQTAVVGRLADTAARGDITGFAVVTLQLRRVVGQARELAAAYGFRVCGRGGSSPVQRRGERIVRAACTRPGVPRTHIMANSYEL